MDNRKSAAPEKSSDAEQTFVHSEGAIAGSQQTNVQRVQNVLLVWLDDHIDENSTDCHNVTPQLRRAVNEINKFTDSDQCIDFVTDIYNEKVCMLISGSICQNIISSIHDITQLHTIFILCTNERLHEQWAKDWPKIQGVFTEISPICEALKQVAEQCEQDAISISFVATSGDDVSKKNLDQLDPIFMYSQILKEILLTIEFGDKHIREYINYCGTVFAGNDVQLDKVDKLQLEYHTRTPIWWYTWESFLYPMLNSALRSTNMDIIIRMGFFIKDLYRHIEQLHSEQFSGSNASQIFILYRGQGMSKSDFDKMRDIQGGLMSFNNFLSTSKDHEVSFGFARRALSNMNMVGILFVMTIDPVKSTTPFASTADVGCYGDKEGEVLFSMHTVFRIDEIISMDGTERLFQVNLTLTSDDDKDLRILTDRIREENGPEEDGWYRLGLLLLRVGEFAKAQQLYEMLLEQATDMNEKPGIYHQLGSVKCNQGEYKEAIIFYEKALEIGKKTLSSTDFRLTSCYHNIGTVYTNMGDYSKALSYYEKVLEIRKQFLPSNHLDLGASYNNIGALYFDMGDYPKALSFHEKALEIRQQSLPSNHPDLSASYNNIGLVYEHMGDYPKALLSHKRALEIKKQSLPSNHPDLGTCYNNIGEVYRNMGDYPNALSYYEKAVEIKQQSLPPNHPALGHSYNNIGLSYERMGDYPKALSSHEKALEIRQKSLPPNHPDLGASYNNIGILHCQTGGYAKAPPYFEKAIEIQQQSLPSNHPDLASSYNNIGNAYYCMGDYRKALSSYEKALEIRKQSPSNHPDSAHSYNNIGSLYFNIDEYSKALSYYEKGLEIQQQSLPPNHPDLGGSYNNIGLVYEHKGDYPKAHSFYERAVKVGQHSLPPNHLELQRWKINLDRVKKKL